MIPLRRTAAPFVLTVSLVVAASAAVFDAPVVAPASGLTASPSAIASALQAQIQVLTPMAGSPGLLAQTLGARLAAPSATPAELLAGQYLISSLQSPQALPLVQDFVARSEAPAATEISAGLATLAAPYQKNDGLRESLAAETSPLLTRLKEAGALLDPDRLKESLDAMIENSRGRSAGTEAGPAVHAGGGRTVHAGDGLPELPPTFAELGGARPAARPKSEHDAVLERLASLPPAQRARMGRYLGQVYDLVSGEGGSPVGKGAASIPAVKSLQQEEADRSPLPAPALPDARLRPLADEVQRLLGDAKGPEGFNDYVMNLALDVYIDLDLAGKLKSGERRVRVVDPRGVAEEQVLVRGLPVVAEQDLAAAVERRLRSYGLDIREFSVAGPAGPTVSYARALQWLYLADRLSHPELNSLKEDMLPPFLNARRYFTGEYIPKEPVARRSPQSPEHVSNLLRLMFEVK